MALDFVLSFYILPRLWLSSLHPSSHLSALIEGEAIA